MSKGGSILVCVFTDLDSDIFKRFIANSVSFAKQVGSDVHFLIPEGTEATINLVLKYFPHNGVQTLQSISHSISNDLSPESIDRVANVYSCELVIVPSRSMSDESGDSASTRKNLLEKLRIPVLFLSPKVDLTEKSIASVLIPMSGEVHVSSALKFGLHLATRIHAPVDLVHVLKEDGQMECCLNTLGDQPHHEYERLIERVLAEGSPFSDTKERAQVRKLYQVQGTPSAEISRIANDHPSCVLIIEWHGSLIQGKAETLKNILQQSDVPVFLVKTESEQKSILKIGPDSHVA